MSTQSGTIILRYIVSCLVLLLFANQACADEYATYVNQTFGISIAYPTGILNPTENAGNGGVVEFHSKDDDAFLVVSGANNTEGKALESLYQENTRVGKTENPQKKVTYRLLKDNWFVVSGYNAGLNSRVIFYQKTLLNDNQFKSFYFQYPESKKSFYDPIVKRVSDSFKG